PRNTSAAACCASRCGTRRRRSRRSSSCARVSCCWCASSVARRCRAGRTSCRRWSARSYGRSCRSCCSVRSGPRGRRERRRGTRVEAAMPRRFLFASRRRFGGERGLGSPELRNRERELFLFKRRLAVAAALALLAFGGLVARFVDLQVIQHSHYQTLAETNRIAIVPVAPNRGVITDRNGVVLAQSYSAYTLEITPSRVQNLDATIDALADLVDVRDRDRRRLRKLMEESKNFESLPLRTKLTDDEVARFAANRYRFPGVEINARLFRQYPYGETASHVVGYIGRINDR